MKLSISNLSWEPVHDDIMHQFLYQHGIAMEVVPSRIFKWEDSKISNRKVSPFEHFPEAADWYRIIHTHYRIDIAAMHSLLYNVDKNIFANLTYRRFLSDYLQSAVQFAVRINCPVLCFGCGPNRSIPEGMDPGEAYDIAFDFFSDLAEYAGENSICIALEPIPLCDGTNFINTTQEALDFARKIKYPAFRVCVNMGAVIENGEDIGQIFTKENMPFISHIHISEPGLAPLQQRQIYKDTAALLKAMDYDKYVSIEMLKFPDVKLIQGAVNYFYSVFS